MDTTNPTSTSSLPPGSKLEISKHHASEIAISKAAYDVSNAQRPPEYQDTDNMIHHQDIASSREPFEITAAVSESDRGGHGRIASSSSTSTNLFHRHQPEYHSSNFAAYSHFHHHHHHYSGGYPVSSVPPVNYYEMGLEDLDSGSANNCTAIHQAAGGDTYSSTGDLMPLAMAAAAAESHEATLSSFSKNLSSRRDGFALKTVAPKESGTKENDTSEKSGDARKRFLERNRIAASKCREKKKLRIQELEIKASQVFEENRELQRTIESMRAESADLKARLNEFISSCRCFSSREFVRTGAL